MHICQASVDAAVADGEFFVIDAEEVEDGGMEIVAGGDILGGFPLPFVALAAGAAGLDASAGEP